MTQTTYIPDLTLFRRKCTQDTSKQPESDYLFPIMNKVLSGIMHVLLKMPFWLFINNKLIIKHFSKSLFMTKIHGNFIEIIKFLLVDGIF